MLTTMGPMPKSNPARFDPGTLQVHEGPETLDENDALALLVSCAAGLTTHRLPAKGQVFVGRGEDVDVLLVDDSVSRRHAVIHAGSPPQIEDLGSTNGTRIAARPLVPGERYPLAVGTVVELGTATLVVQRAATSGTVPVDDTLATAARKHHGAVVRDPEMQRLYELLDMIATAPIPVLILGETGVGKEVYAQAVHTRSQRATKPFLQLNCAALPETILESELFGHERGAFTGAVQTKTGLLESADGGTVFLDEVGELPLVTQAKLLRFLESGELLRVGAVKPRRVDVRLVSATNRDLKAAISTGHFRADLFFRLNGIAVTLPPVRERRSEIPSLVEYFVDRACTKIGRPSCRVSQSAMVALVGYRWPGNVRELRNVVERAVVLSRGGTIEPEHLLLPKGDSRPPGLTVRPGAFPPPTEATGTFMNVASTPLVAEPGTPDRGSTTNLVAHPQSDPMAQTGAVGANSGPIPRGTSLIEEMEAYERQRILQALQQCAGNQSRAAELLGITRRMLITRLEQHGISRPRKRTDPR